MFLEDYNKSLENIKNVIESKNKRIEYLEEENKKLKDEAYKDSEIQRLKEENDRLRQENRNGFQISNEEYAKLIEWKNKHLREKHWDARLDCPKSFGAIGGNFTYSFIPTSIGCIGECKCSCGESFCFQEI